MAGLLLVKDGGLLDEEGRERLGVDVAGERRVEPEGLDAGGDELVRGARAIGEGLDPGALAGGPEELEVEAEVVDDRKRRAAVEVGGEEGGPGGVRGLLAELGGEEGRLLLEPPGGRREE